MVNFLIQQECVIEQAFLITIYNEKTNMEQVKNNPSPAAIKAKAALDRSFKVRGVATAIGSGFFYGQYTAFMTLGMALGIWQFWYGADSGLSSFAVIFFLSALGSALIDSCSGLWAFSICTARGKFKDLFRCLKTKPGAIMVVAAIIGGPIASTAYVVGLQQAGSIVVPISALCAAFGAIISRFLFKQALTPRIILGITICFLASFIIGYSGLSLENQANVPLGLAFGFLAALCWGIEGCICGYGTSLIDPEIGITFRQCTSGLVNLLFLVPIFAFFADVNPITMFTTAVADFESSKWFILGGFVAYLNFMLWYKGNGMCGTALGMACNGMFAFWGPFFCWLVLGVGFGIEGWDMSLTAWLAAVLMVFGIFILSMNPLDLLKSKKVA